MDKEQWCNRLGARIERLREAAQKADRADNLRKVLAIAEEIKGLERDGAHLKAGKLLRPDAKLVTTIREGLRAVR